MSALIPITASAQPPPPLECWWRTDRPAIRVAEPFALLLTCAIHDSDAVHVAVDQGPLDPGAIAVAPFEVVDGGNLSESHVEARRFFQREYRLRLMTDGAFGRDVAVPSVSVTYRLQQTSTSGVRTQGIERRLELPPLPIRVLSLVPAGARDIRDAPATTFRALEDAAFRSSMMITAGTVLVAIGALGLVIAVAAGVRRQRPAASRPAPLSDRVVLRVVERELAAVRHAREDGSWTPDLVARALTALRIGAGCLIARPPSQRLIEVDAEAPEGALLHHRRDGGHIAISAPITPETLRAVSQRVVRGVHPQARETRAADADVRAMETALAEFTRASYGAGQPPAPTTLDEMFAAAEGVVRDLHRQRTPRLVAWFR